MKVLRQCKRRNTEKLCYSCGAVLEVTPKDARKEPNRFDELVYYTTCPNCSNSIFLGDDFEDIFPWDYKRV